jgi:hypothetical protein
MAKAKWIQLPRTPEMIMKLGIVTGLAHRAAATSGVEEEKADVIFVRQAIHEALGNEDA